MSIAGKLMLLEKLVSIPLYAVVGFTSSWLVYASTRGGILSLWAVNPRSGEDRLLVPGPVHGYARPRHPDTKVIYIRDVARGRELHRIFSTDLQRGGEEVFVDAPPMRIFGLAYDGRRLAFSGATMSGMALYLAEESGEPCELLRPEGIMTPTDVSDRYIVGSGILSGDPRSMELFIYDLKEGRLRVYTPRRGSVNKAPRLYGSRMLFESNYEGSSRLYVYDLGEDRLEKPVMEGSDYAEYSPVEHVDYGWTSDGRIWAVGVREGRSRAFVDGYLVPSPGGFIGSMDVSPGGEAYYSLSTLTSPPKIYAADLGGSARVVIDNELPAELASRLGESRHIWYASDDGLSIPAFVVESRAAAKPGPTIVYVHGGPWGAVTDSWSMMIAGLVVSGYHVVAPNFRGSTGYGEKYRLLDIGDPGGGDLMDVVAARHWAVETGLADKVAIMGYSYGGYMTYLALGRKPDAWDAGVAGAGIVDWAEMYGLSDALFKKFIETLFDGYRENLMHERSPIRYVDRIRAPLCIIHPQNDTRTPLKPVLRYMAKLLEKNKLFEAHILPNVGHRIISMDDMTRLLLPAIMFLDRYLCGKEAGSLMAFSL